MVCVKPLTFTTIAFASGRSKAGMVDFIVSIKDLATSMNDSEHCVSDHWQCLSNMKVSFQQLFNFLLLACFDSSTMSARSEIVVVLKDSVNSL